MRKATNRNNPWTLFLKQRNSDYFPQLTFAPPDDKNAVLFNALFRLLCLNTPIMAFFMQVAFWLLSKAAASKSDITGFNGSG